MRRVCVAFALLRERPLLYIKRPCPAAIPSPSRPRKRGGDGPHAMTDEKRPPKPPPRPRGALPARGGSSEGGAGGLVRYDPLRAYMAEVARHPVLSREEEHALAVRYRETGDVEAAYKLVASNLRLVVKIAHEYRRTAFQLLDLVQEGNLGLMQAVKKYDPWKGVKLSSYAAWWIRAYIIRFVMENWRMVKLGTTQAQRKLFFNLAKEREKLLARGIEPTPRLLAKNLQVEVKEVEEMSARMAGEDVSLDAPLRAEDEDSRQSRMDRVAAANGPPPDERMGDEQLRRIFREKLETFAKSIVDEKERFIFEKRLLPPEGEAPLTLQEVGDRFRLTRERARQIEAKLTARLREYLRDEIPDFELLGPPSD
jgi:RNA polymerase sigma-32 factor